MERRRRDGARQLPKRGPGIEAVGVPMQVDVTDHGHRRPHGLDEPGAFAVRHGVVCGPARSRRAQTLPAHGLRSDRETTGEYCAVFEESSSACGLRAHHALLCDAGHRGCLRGDGYHLPHERLDVKVGCPGRHTPRLSEAGVRDPEPNAADIIGRSLHPPRHAAISSVDERSVIQALDRRDRVLPSAPGRVERHGFLARKPRYTMAMPHRRGRFGGSIPTRRDGSAIVKLSRRPSTNPKDQLSCESYPA